MMIIVLKTYSCFFFLFHVNVLPMQAEASLAMEKSRITTAEIERVSLLSFDFKTESGERQSVKTLEPELHQNSPLLTW